MGRRPTKDKTAEYKHLSRKYDEWMHRTLWDKYETPSANKREVWTHLIRLREMLEAESKGPLCVMTGNTYNFTAAFKYLKEGKWYLRIYYPTHTEDIPYVN